MHWTVDEPASLQLEAQGPVDENFHVIQTSLASSEGEHELDINGLRPTADYRFRIRAEDYGQITYSQEIEATTTPATGTVPTLPPPTGLDTSDWSSEYKVRFTGPFEGAGNKIILTYSQRLDDSYGVLGFPHFDQPANPAGWFLFGRDDAYDYWATGTITARGQNVRIWFQVLNESTNERSAWSEPVTLLADGDPIPPLHISATSPSPDDPTKVRIQWDDLQPWLSMRESLNVYRVHDGQATLAGAGIFNNWVDVEPGASGDQFFAVYYATGVHCSPYSNFVTADLALAPAAPGGVSAGLSDKNKVRLVWDNTASNETSYTIQKKLHDAATWTDVTSVAADTASAEISLGDDPEQYTKLWDFRVVSVNDGGQNASPVASQSGIALQSVTFSGDQAIVRDNGTGAYSGPEWYDINLDGYVDPDTAYAYENGTIDNPAGEDHVYPISYLRSVGAVSSYVHASPVLAFRGTKGANWMVKAEGGGLTLSTTEALQNGGGWLWTTLDAGQGLPDTIDSRELELTWKASTNNGKS